MRRTFLILIAVLAVGCSQSTPLQPDHAGSLGTPMSTAPASSVTSSASAAAAPSQAGQGGTHHSEQVIFSGVAGTSSTFPNGSPAGFWIWCEAESTNPYHGECNGSMYFYALHLTKHVEGEIEETGDELYTMTVSSTLDHSLINCELTNESHDHGPKNVVHVSCETPAGSAVSSNAVVNVTGP